MTERRAARVDVLLLVEGSYPFVAGGVANWVHQLVNGFSRISFGVVFLGGRAADYGSMRYPLPDNVRHFEAHYLFEAGNAPRPEPVRGDAATFARIADLHRCLRDPDRHDEGARMIGELSEALGSKLTLQDFLFGERAFEYLRTEFERASSDPSFVDYFWTVRAMHTPLWRLAAIRDRLPEARVLHALATGYAGLLGVMAKRRSNRPLILSEHGIYTKERRIDLAAADWITDNRTRVERSVAELGYFRSLWIRFFESIGRACYAASDSIVALDEGNRVRQIADGAAAGRTRVIPNGVDPERFAVARLNRPATPPLVIGLIARIVAIKDVKTFIRAMRTVVNRLPAAEGWVIGPTEEDSAYARECADLAETLGLSGSVKFLGRRDPVELLPQIGVLALTSISESLPYAVLEAFAAGVPAVLTDVGACRALVHGHGPDDQALGAAGAVVGIGDAAGFADAAITLLSDQRAWSEAARAALHRVERFYSEERMLAGYREVYRRALRSGYPRLASGIA